MLLIQAKAIRQNQTGTMLILLFLCCSTQIYEMFMINLVKISKFKAKQLGVTHLSVKQTLAISPLHHAVGSRDIRT